MATLNVPGTYSTIRAALIAAGNGDTIEIAAGSYDITAAGYNNSLAYSATPNCSTGFINGVTSLIYQGAGKFDPLNPYTSITGNARLFQKNVDGKAPASVVYTALDFLYTGGSGYILQTGDFGVSVANTVTKSIEIVNDSFRGTHTGNAGASGNYAAVLGIQFFVMSDSSVSLTGQAGFNAAAGTGGSSFLMLNGGTGGSIDVASTSFDEAGYRNALSIFDSVNVTLVDNTFFRSSNRNVRGGGEKLKDTTGTVASNKFFDGSYLAVEKVSTGSVTVTSNIFAQFDPAGSTIPNPISGGGAVGIVLQGASASTALSNVAGNTFSYVAPFANTTASTITINAPLGAISNTYIDPITNTTKNFNTYYAGGTNADTLTGTTSPEYFIGGTGNDTIVTAGGDDYILFNTALNAATNVDTITGFNSSSRIILDRKIFKGISATYDGTTLSSIGAVNNSTQVENNNTGTASSVATRIIYNTSTGSLLYDADGLGGVAAVEFAKLYSAGTDPYNSTGMVGFNGSNLNSVNIGII